MLLSIRNDRKLVKFSTILVENLPITYFSITEKVSLFRCVFLGCSIIQELSRRILKIAIWVRALVYATVLHNRR